jgi:hypothetical protein
MLRPCLPGWRMVANLDSLLKSPLYLSREVIYERWIEIITNNKPVSAADAPTPIEKKLDHRARL